MSNDSLIITSSISPFDVSILLLIYEHCFSFNKETQTPIEVFLTLITPTLPAQEYNPILQDNVSFYSLPKPLFPTLLDLYQYLDGEGYHFVFLKLMGMLVAIDDFDIVMHMLKRIETECLVRNYRESRESKKLYKTKKVVRSSLMGSFLTRLISRYYVYEFEEKEQLWDNFKLFIGMFTKSNIWENIKSEVKPYDEFLSISRASTDNEDIELKNFLNTMSGSIFSSNELGTMVSHTHFQAILNWEAFVISHHHTIDEPKMEKLFNNLSLYDSTKFPTIHLLKYLIALENYCYQDAITSLHNYFDYMLTQNAENYFHISLLGLGTLYAYFHDCEPAISSYKEATKVAREYKDSTILNLIMLWIVNFIQDHPEYTDRFQVMINQIVRYLKISNENENSFIFESAYKFETLLKMSKNDSSIDILETRCKYSSIALQSFLDINEMNQYFRHSSTLWEYFGCKSLVDIYRRITTKGIDKMLNKIMNALANPLANPTESLMLINSIDAPNLTYQHQMYIRMLIIKYLLLAGDYQAALNSLPNLSNTKFMDIHWQTIFELEKCNILIASGNGIRSLPLMMKLVDIFVSNKNPKFLNKALTLLMQTMKQMHKAEELRLLKDNNIVSLLYYDSFQIDDI